MSPLHPTPLVAALLLALATGAWAQDPAPLVQAVSAAPRPGLLDGAISERPLTLGVGLGYDDAGAFVAMRAGLGFSPTPRFRVDLVGTLALGQPRIPGYDAVLARASADLRLGYRIGALQPWIGAGLLAASLSGEGPTTENPPLCLPGLPCIPTGSSTATLDESTKGRVVSAGIELAPNPAWLLGLELRKAFLPVKGFGGTGLLLSMAFFFR